MQSLGHSILGDRLYASAAVAQQAPRLLLHASGLAFRHPSSGRDRHFFSRAPF
jgi:tRNA pseudouridine32 synthase/23S rRNA pseudouridine746 synthase